MTDKSKTAEKSKPEELTVTQLSVATGNRLPRSRNPNAKPGPNAMHAMADQKHGWSWYAHHYAKPVRMTKECYESALKAVLTFGEHASALAPKWDEARPKAPAKKETD